MPHKRLHLISLLCRQLSLKGKTFFRKAVLIFGTETESIYDMRNFRKRKNRLF